MQLSEVDLIHNPSLGAYLLRCSVSGYFSECSRGMPVHLAFLVLPIALHWQSRQLGFGTNRASGLTMFAAKLGAHQEDLLAVHARALVLRELSLSSITLGCGSRLMAIDPISAVIIPLDAGKLPKQSDSIQKLGGLCEKFGAWFARLPPEQVASVLRIEF